MFLHLLHADATILFSAYRQYQVFRLLANIPKSLANLYLCRNLLFFSYIHTFHFYLYLRNGSCQKREIYHLSVHQYFLNMMLMNLSVQMRVPSHQSVNVFSLDPNPDQHDNCLGRHNVNPIKFLNNSFHYNLTHHMYPYQS